MFKLAVVVSLVFVGLHQEIEEMQENNSDLITPAMEFTPESLKSLLCLWPTLADQRDKSSGNVTDLDYVDAPISYSEFFTKYVVLNVPCLIGDWITRSWPSTISWCHKESGRIHWDHLSLQFGEFISLTVNLLRFKDVKATNRLESKAIDDKFRP